MQKECEDALKGETDLDKKFVTLGNLNKLSYEDLTCQSILILL